MAAPARPSIPTVTNGTPTDPLVQLRAAYSQNETAAMLGVTRQHIARLIAADTIRAVRLGRRVLIPAVEIERLLGGGA